MRRKNPHRQFGALLAGSGTVAGISIAATAVFAAVGFPALPDTGPAAVAAEEPAAAVGWEVTPAATALTSVLEKPPAGWKPVGDLQRAVIAPLPYSCPVQNSAASTSLARTFTVDGKQMRVILQSYTAGLGAEALNQMYTNAAVCAGAEGAVASSPIYGDSPGRDGKTASVSHGGQRTAVVSFRLGDVIAFTTGADSQALINAAVKLDGVLESALKTVCKNTASTAADATRSPFSRAGYKTHTRTDSVKIPAVELPKANPDPASPSPSAAPAPAPSPIQETYPIPAPVLVKDAAVPMDRPGFPVWPDMPEPLEVPEPPKSPAPEATVEKKFQVPAEDTEGPGCGWKFTGLKAPGFDPAAAEASAKKQSADSLEDLKADAKTWQDDVLVYWKSYTEYEKQSEAYRKYAAKVDETNSAWAITAGKWDEFNAAMEVYNADKAAREDFLARQDTARAEYEDQVKACLAPAPAPAPEPEAPAEADTETGPLPSPSPTPSATQRPEPREGCPAVKPEILEEKEPAVPTAPREPEDPRP